MAFGIVRVPRSLDESPVLRVLQVFDSDVLARLGPMLRVMLRQLRAHAIEPSVLTDAPELAREFVEEAIPITDVETFTGWRAWRIEQDLARRFPSPPTLVHAWGARACSAAARWTQNVGVPLLVHVTSSHDASFLRRRGLQLNQWCVAMCRRHRTKLEERWPATAGLVEYLAPAAEPVRSSREEPGVTPAIVWTGRRDEHEGLPALIEAVAQVRKHGHEVHVALVGEPVRHGALWKRIMANGVADCFSVVQEPRFVELSLKAASVLVVTAKQTALSAAPLAAMASGVVVTAARSQAAEWLANERAVLHFADGSAKELAYQLTRVLEDRQEVRETREYAREYAAEHHGMDAAVEKLDDIYRSIVGSVPTAGATT